MGIGDAKLVGVPLRQVDELVGAALAAHVAEYHTSEVAVVDGTIEEVNAENNAAAAAEEGDGVEVPLADGAPPRCYIAENVTGTVEG